MFIDAGSIGQRAKLPVIHTLGAAYVRVFGRLGDVVALAAAPFVVSVAGEAFIQFDPAGMIAALVETDRVPAAYGLVLFIRFLTSFLPWAAFVAAWHRCVLLGRRDGRGPIEFYPETGEASVFRSDLFLAAFLAGSAIVLTLIALWLLEFPPNFHRNRLTADFTLLTLLLLLDVRFVLMHPAVAAGHETSAGMAWNQSKGIALRLVCILVLVTLPFHIVDFTAIAVHVFVGQSGVAEAAGGGESTEDYVALGRLLLATCRGIVLYLGTAVLVVALCLSYRHAISGCQPKKGESITASDVLNHFMLPMTLGALLGLAGYWVAELLDFAVKEQFLLAGVAFLAPLVWTIYRLEPR